MKYFYQFFVAAIILFSVATIVKAENIIFINEFVVDADTEWIELYNASDSADYLKNYFLDDDPDFENDIGSRKKILTNLVTSENKYPYLETSSFLNNAGDKIVLFDPSGQIIDQYEYTTNPGVNVSIGRYPDKTGEFNILTGVSKGGPNSPTASPFVSPSATATGTPHPTPTKTATPTPLIQAIAPTKTPTKTPTPPPTIKATISASGNIATPSGTVLGILTKNMSTPFPEVVGGKKPGEESIKNKSKILIGLGVGFVFFGVVLTLRANLYSPNTHSIKSDAENDI